MSNISINFDFSQWDFPTERIWLHKSSGEMTWKVCTFVPLIIFGLYGNYMMIFLIATNRTLRSPTNLIIANMAAADALTLLICPVMFLLNDFYQNYPLGSVGCKLEGFLVALFLITGVLNLSVVSYDRLTAIVLPSEKRLTLRGAKIVIACTWLAGVIFALPLALYRSYRIRIWKNFTESYCKENPNVLPKYWYVLITILVWLPLAIMLICYTAIFYKLDRYKKSVLRREHPLTVSYKRSVAKTMFIVVAVFAALRLPFTILVVIQEKQFSSDSTVNSGMQLFWYISQYLMFLNAAVNPVIYGYNNENLRRAYNKTKCAKRATLGSPRPHRCCYCTFMKMTKPPTGLTACLKNSTANGHNQEIQESKGTYKFYNTADDMIVSNVNDVGFI
ncbi:neuropeptide FF receptor 2 [Scaptodrosophila lebanonensis]|uniref:Neuropeptide FF receptor 2 n=1 Tax=Drosophila lebanonensis TaxID=7225 RepID=A0A6J2UJN9_DROLE|nr:neuropeptide FF receptor 2 [Scaptodrosophila lebanonensis]